MKSDKFGLKVFSVALSLVMTFSLFSGCSHEELPENSVSVGDEAPQEENGLKLGVDDKHLTPDVSDVKLSEPSKAIKNSESEQACIETLNTFANPNGNEFDAASVLGKFRYNGKTDEEIMNKLKNASADWHKTVAESVGEKCIVRIELLEKEEIDLNDAKVTDWNAANGKTAEAFSNVKCSVSTNYSSGTVKVSFDLVKTEGSWYLANTTTINKIQNVIMNEIYK